MSPILSAEALAELFDEFDWFQCGSCPSLSPPPGSAELPQRVELVLRDFGTGGLNRGDLRTYRSLRLTATEVREWSFAGEVFYYAAEHSTEGAEPVKSSRGFGLILDVPTPVRLVASAFDCERLPDVTETVAPWTSGNEFGVAAQRAGWPSPADWVEALARHGAEVTWRVYGGPAKATEGVPSDYGGWFLERPSCLSEHDGGVFVRFVGEHAHGIALIMDRNQADSDLWHAVCRSVGDMFPDGVFRTGNCQFTAEEWHTHITKTSD